MQHGPSILAINAVLLILAMARQNVAYVQLSALPLAIAFTLRPANAIWIAALTACIALHYRTYLVGFLLCCCQSRYRLVVQPHHSARHISPLLHNSRAQCSSAARQCDGQFFQPVARVICLYAGGPILGSGHDSGVETPVVWPVSPYLISIAAVHTVLFAPILPGHTYGPRYFCDLSGVFVLFLIPYFSYRRELRASVRMALTAVFVVFAGWGLFVHIRGATSTAANYGALSL